MRAPHHPYTECEMTAPRRLALMRDFAKNLTRLSGADADAFVCAAAELSSKSGAAAHRPGQQRPAHAIKWRGHAIQLLTPEQWAAVPASSDLPLLNVAAAWRERAPDIYEAGGVEDPSRTLLPLWAKLCSDYPQEVTQTFWPPP
eukprot:gene6634-200_t